MANVSYSHISLINKFRQKVVVDHPWAVCQSQACIWPVAIENIGRYSVPIQVSPECLSAADEIAALKDELAGINQALSDELAHATPGEKAAIIHAAQEEKKRAGALLAIAERKFAECQLPYQSLGLRMQFQESFQWCWIAVATSINHFYNPASTLTQCELMTVVGQTINGFPINTSACPSSQVIAATPGLAATLANPYSKTAQYVLDNAALGINGLYLKSGGVGDALNVRGNRAGYQGADLALAQIDAEVQAGRPVAVDINWNSGGSHVVVISGVIYDFMTVLDPANGTSIVNFKSFPATYFQGAKVSDYCFTRP